MNDNDFYTLQNEFYQFQRETEHKLEQQEFTNCYLRDMVIKVTNALFELSNLTINRIEPCELIKIKDTRIKFEYNRLYATLQIKTFYDTEYHKITIGEYGTNHDILFPNLLCYPEQIINHLNKYIVIKTFGI